MPNSAIRFETKGPCRSRARSHGEPGGTAGTRHRCDRGSNPSWPQVNAPIAAKRPKLPKLRAPQWSHAVCCTAASHAPDHGRGQLQSRGGKRMADREAATHAVARRADHVYWVRKWPDKPTWRDRLRRWMDPASYHFDRTATPPEPWVNRPAGYVGKRAGGSCLSSTKARALDISPVPRLRYICLGSCPRMTGSSARNRNAACTPRLSRAAM